MDYLKPKLIRLRICDYNHIYIQVGARVVTVFVVENGNGDVSSNSVRGWLRFT